MRLKSLYTSNYKILKNFKIDFTYPLTVVCGINGSGKTSLLEFIYQFFSKDKLINHDKRNYIDIENLNEENIQTMRIDKKWLKTDSELFKIIHDKVIYFRAGEEYHPARELIVNFIDELIYEKDTKSSIAYSILRDKIKSLSEGLNLDISFKMLDKKKDIFFSNTLSDKIRIEDLSGGEKELITKLLPLYLSGIKNSVILIDEPESSLHPNWQSNITDLYRQAAIQNNNQLIITTHSPFVVSAVEDDNLRILQKNNGIIEVISGNRNIYGKKVDEILLDIFRVKTLRTPEVDEDLNQLNEMLENNNYNTQEFKKLLSKLENLLGKYDSDLAMIRMERKKKEKESESYS